MGSKVKIKELSFSMLRRMQQRVEREVKNMELEGNGGRVPDKHLFLLSRLDAEVAMRASSFRHSSV